MDTLDRRTLLKAGGGTLAACGLSGLLAACGTSGGSGSSVSTLQLSNDKPTWQSWFQSEGNRVKQAVGVGWTPREYSDEQVYEAAIRTSGIKPPDMFTWQSNYLMKDIVSAGFLTDLTGEWKKQGDAYSAGLSNLFTFAGKTYGAPLYIAPWVVFYNMQVFDKYQLKPPTSWDEMQQVLATLKGNGIAPLGATVDGVWSFVMFQTLLVASDPQLYQDLLDGKVKYTDSGVVDVMNLWGQMLKAGYFTDPSSVTFSTRGTNFATPFKQGKAAMVQIGTWFETNFTSAGMRPGVDYGAFIFPSVKPDVQKTVVIESGPLCVAAHGSHQADAIKTVNWFMSKEGQQAWVKLSGLISGRSDVPAPSSLDQQIMSELQSGGYQQVSRYYESTQADIVQTAIDEFQKFLLHPGDPMPILSAIQRQADSVGL